MFLMAAMFGLLMTFTFRAASIRHILDNRSLMSDVWFQVTLLDAYIGFTIFYVWVACKERSLLRKSVWFLLIISFGNLATTAYVMLQLVRCPEESGQITSNKTPCD
jgi:hypothetical protein